MIHKILLWICGIASILGIILYIIDKTTKKDFSLRLTLSLLLGGIFVAIILAITEPNSDKTTEGNLKETNTNKADTIQSVSTKGNSSPAIISNGRDVEINYNNPIDGDTINN